MHPSLPAIAILPRQQQQVLAELIQKVVTAVQPEKIICYGIRSIDTHEWGCFSNDGAVKDTTRLKLDLLIIAPATKGQTEQDISFAAEQQCKALADVFCVTHKIHSVKEGLANGNPFYSTLYHKGLLIYDSGQTELHSPSQMPAPLLELPIIEAIWLKWYGLALHFYKSAVDSQHFERPDLTAFMLHQAVEHTCGALIRVFSGYRPNTHNLTRLLMMVENFTQKITQVFPRSTREEEELYGIIQRAYLDARYKDNYTVPAGSLDLLIRRVHELQSIAASLYAEKLALYSLPLSI